MDGFLARKAQQRSLQRGTWYQQEPSLIRKRHVFAETKAAKKEKKSDSSSSSSGSETDGGSKKDKSKKKKRHRDSSDSDSSSEVSPHMPHMHCAVTRPQSLSPASVAGCKTEQEQGDAAASATEQLLLSGRLRLKAQ